MFPSTALIELICFIFAVIYLSNDKDSFWRHLIWFMLAITLLDGAGWSMAVLLHKKNHWIYNIELPLEVLFIVWLFSNILKTYFKTRVWAVIVVSLFFILYTRDIINSGFNEYADFTDTIAALIFVIASGIFYFYLLKEERYVELFKYPPFWLVTGMFLFYFGSTALNVFFDELMQLNVAKGIPLRYIIFTILNGILYGCWIYAFKCTYQQNILSSR